MKRIFICIFLILTIILTNSCFFKQRNYIKYNNSKKEYCKDLLFSQNVYLSHNQDTNSKALTIQRNNYKKKFLPETIFIKYPNIEKISIGGYDDFEINKNLEQIFSELGCFKKLKKIEFGRENIDCLPYSIYMIDSLTELDLRGNKIKNISENVKYLRMLNNIKLDDNELGRLSIAELNHLFLKLSLINNLEELYLSNNFLDTIPNSIGRINNLRYLNIRGNYIKYLPESIKNLKMLKFIDIVNNEFNDFPSCLTELDSLYSISMDFVPNIMQFPKYLDNFKHKIYIELFDVNKKFNLKYEIIDSLNKRYPNIRWSINSNSK